MICDDVKMWTFNKTKCLDCTIRCCSYYGNLNLQEIDVDNLLSIGLNLDNHISVDKNGRVYLMLNPCPFLKDSLCDIHKRYGFNFKPLRCQFYPYRPEIINGEVQISLFKGCPGVESGNNPNLAWVEKTFLENYTERPTMYRLLYMHYVTRSAFVEFTEQYWDDFEITDDSLIAFLYYLLYFSEDKRKILNKDALKVYLDNGDLKNTIMSIKHSWQMMVAKKIMSLYSGILLFMIDINHPKVDYSIKKGLGDKTINDYVLEKTQDICDSDLFTSYATILPSLCAIQNLRIKTKNELLAIKLFETQYGFASFRKKRLICILNNLLPWMLLILNPIKKRYSFRDTKSG